MDAKPRGRIYWTNDHPKHDEVGVLVVGRVKIPVQFFLVTSGFLGVVFFFYGFIWGLVNKHADGTGNIGGFLPLGILIGLWALVGLILLLTKGVAALFRWLAVYFREAQMETKEEIRKSRPDYDEMYW